MRPSSVPDDEIWEGGKRVTLGAPPGLEKEIAPLEVISTNTELGHEFAFRVEVDEADLEKLRLTGAFYVTFISPVFPPVQVMHSFDRM